MDIPQDIIDNVIAAVGDDDQCLLKQCTLVSSSFLLPSRKQLFSRISLRSRQSCQAIHQLLVQNPVIQSSVRTITLTDRDHLWGEIETPYWMNGTSLLAILRLPFCRLERFSIIISRDLAWSPWDWNDFSCELKDAVSNILQSSTLKTLSLTGITKVPSTFLQIVHPTTLELSSLSPSDFGGESSPTQAPTTSHTVIDRCVWTFLRRDHRGLYGRFESIFLPFLCRLRFFEIHFVLDSDALDILSFFIGSLCISLTSPATLERLELKICFRENYFNPYRFYENLCNTSVWSHLDSITSHPTSSWLQRVDVNIDYSYYCDGGEEPVEDEVMKVVLDGLPLLRTKGILFVKVTLGDLD